MDGFLNAKLDSDDEDEDYVPQKEEMSEDSAKKYKFQEDEENLTGIA